MKISIANKLKKQLHKDQGYLQDELMNILYDLFPDLILHGGTTIWRCFNGNRFSEDLNFYLSEETIVENKFKLALEKEGLTLVKYKTTDNVIFSKISDNKVEVRVEIRLLKKNDTIFAKKVIKEYEKIDGSTITINTLSANDLLLEKANAFVNRKLVRDIYDVYFLSNFIEDSKEYDTKVIKLISQFQEPIDETTFKSIILAGITPTVKQMKDAINKRFR